MKSNEGSTSDHKSDRGEANDVRTDHRQDISWLQAHEAAYRYIVHYYNYERVVPILRLVKSISGELRAPDDVAWTTWQTCVRETLDGAPLPEIPPPWA